MQQQAFQPGKRIRWRRITAGLSTAPMSEDSAAGRTVPREIVASVLPASMLHDDEVVLMLLKPSLWFIFVTSLKFIVPVLLLAMLAVRVLTPGGFFSPRQAAVLTTIAVMGRLVWGLLVWTSHIYLLTNQRIVTIKGVINVAIFQTNLRKIQRTTLFRPWVERILGLGTVGFATAATYEFDSTWVMIANPMEVHERIVAAIRRVQG